jgi:hypothetical protein
MFTDFLVKLLVLLALFAGVSRTAPAPVAAPAAEPAPSAASVFPALQAALAFVPPTAQQLYFTNWAAIKAAGGASAVTGASPLDTKMELLLELDKSHAPTSGFGLAYLSRQWEQWGWDTTDLLWEATIQGEGPPAFVLRLRDDFDMGKLQDRFETRGFVREDQNGAILYTHDLDLTVDWRTELGVFNAAVLPEEHILIHASSPEALQPVLDAYSSGANWRGLSIPTALAAALDDPLAAILLPGPEVCATFGPAALMDILLHGEQPDADELAAIQRQFFGEAPLHPYLGLAVGYRYMEGRPAGTIVFEYPSTEAAAEDLAARRQLAAEGQSLVAEAPIRDRLFTLESAAVSGSSLRLDVRPADDRPRRLFDMLSRRDMPFAACVP